MRIVHRRISVLESNFYDDNDWKKTKRTLSLLLDKVIVVSQLKLWMEKNFIWILLFTDKACLL